MKEFKLNNTTVFVTQDYKEMSKKGAAVVEKLLKTKPNALLGLATGGTPIGMYKELISKNQAGNISFKEVSTYNLDEYYPIDKTNEKSYNYFMKENLFNHIDIKIENTHIPNGMAKDSKAEGVAYEKNIRDIGGLDLQVVGIGANGHIGFNEPSDVFESSTHKVHLDQRTIEDNARFFKDIHEVPTEAITMGIGTIMCAKHILLLASGEGKAAIIKEMLTGKVSPEVQASILQLHPKVTIVLDEEAASELLNQSI